jgi:hypothetical protein
MNWLFLAGIFMNPLQWLKAIYETFGTPYPRTSLVAVAFLGAICFVAIWLFAAKQVERDRQAPSTPRSMSGPASSTGDNSPANTGNGNDFRYDESSHPENKPKPHK